MKSLKKYIIQYRYFSRLPKQAVGFKTPPAKSRYANFLSLESNLFCLNSRLANCRGEKLGLHNKQEDTPDHAIGNAFDWYFFELF